MHIQKLVAICSGLGQKNAQIWDYDRKIYMGGGFFF